MRFPVFGKHSNHMVDAPILRKKMPFLESEVGQLRADWVDPSNHSAGIICRSLFRGDTPLESILSRVAGSGFDSAWSERQSGYAGPLVWQMNS